MKNERTKAWKKLAHDRIELHNKRMEEIRAMDVSHEEKKRLIQEMYDQLENMAYDVKRKEEVEKRKEKMDFDVSERLYSIKSGFPLVTGKYDFSRPDYFYFEYVNVLDEFNQDWQIDEYEKLTKKVWKILTRYYVSYINDGYDKRKERAKQEILTGIYRRMMILCVEKDMTFDEYINLTDGDLYAMTFDRIYEFTLHDFVLSDVMGYNIEEMRKFRFNPRYIGGY